MLKTRLSKLLGIEFPIFSAPMGPGSLFSNIVVIFPILLVLTIFGLDYESCYQSLATIVAIPFIGLTLDIVTVL